MNGLRNPKADNLINFSLQGEGEIIAVHNSNPMSIESFTLPRCKAWQGRCLVIINSNGREGEIKLIASSEGIKDCSVILRAESVPVMNAVIQGSPE